MKSQTNSNPPLIERQLKASQNVLQQMIITVYILISATAILSTYANSQPQQQARSSEARASGQNESSLIGNLPTNRSGQSLGANQQSPSLAPSLRQIRQTTAGLNLTELTRARQRWRSMEQSIGDSLQSVSKRLRLQLDELLAEGSTVGQRQVSQACRVALGDLLDGLGEQRLTAVQMLDASARLPSGILEGTLSELGNFDQCLAIGQAEGGKQPVGVGQYCTVQIKPSLPVRPRLHTVCQRLPALSAQAVGNNTANLFRSLSQNSHQFHYVGLRLGLCTPSRCSRADIQQLLAAYLARYELIGQVKLCQVAPAAQAGAFLASLDPVQQCVMSAFVVLIGLVLVGTLLDRSTKVEGKTGRVRVPASGQVNLASSATGCNTTTTPITGSPTLTSERETLESSNLDSDKPIKRGWHHYQVYRDPLDSSFTKVACGEHSDVGQSLLGLQRNPLAEPSEADNSSEDLLHIHQDDRPGNPSNNIHRLNAQLSNERWLAELERAAMVRDLKRHHLSHRCNQLTKTASPTTRGLSSGLRLILTCFSLKRNLASFGQHKRNSKGAHELDDIRPIHGLRTLAMIWIIFGHTIGLVNPEMMNNLFALAQLSCSSRLLQALLNATLAVNTFFMLSGLVTVLSFARRCASAKHLLLLLPSEPKPALAKPEVWSIDSSSPSSLGSSLGSSASLHHHRAGMINATKVPTGNKKTSKLSRGESKVGQGRELRTGNVRELADYERPSNILGWPADFQPILWLLARYVRLTPAYLATIGFTLLMPALGSGPFWSESVGQLAGACRSNWWLNLVYANNFLNTDRLCLIHSWYLSNDTQFFLLALITFGLFYKSRKLTLLWLFVLAASATAASFALTVANEFPPTIVTTSPAIAERWTFIHAFYYKPWPHLCSYLIGLIAGYLILMKDRIHLSSASRAVGWLLSSVLAFSLLLSVYPWNMGLQVDPILTGVHSATFRTLWSVCCAWLIFALATRPQSALSRLLGWHGFQLSSRLTYCTYLVHPLVIYYNFGALRERMDSSVYGQCNRFAATVALSYLFALLLVLLIESPTIQIQGLLVSSLANPAQDKDKRRDHQLSLRGAKKGSSSAKGSQVIPANGRNGGGAKVKDWPVGDGDEDEDEELLMRCQMKRKRHQRAGSAGESFWCAASSFTALGSQATGPSSAADSLQVIQIPSASYGSKQLDSNETIGSGQQCRRNNTDDSQSPATSSSLADADFQRRLAQAISRGFRIRSRMANGTQRQRSSAAACRATQTKRVPLRQPMFVGSHLSEMRLGQEDEGCAHRANNSRNSCSTFVGCPSHQQPAQLDAHQPVRLRRMSHDNLAATGGGGGGGGALPVVQPPPPPPPSDMVELRMELEADRNHSRAQSQRTNFSDLILMKQKLLSRSHNQINL